MDRHNSVKLIDQLKTQGITVYRAINMNSDGIFFSQNNGLEEFISFATNVGIKQMFIQLTLLEEDDLDYITDEMLQEKDIPDEYLTVIKKETLKFNKQLDDLRKYIGEEQSIHLFFTHDGTIFTIILTNEELYPEDSEDFLEEILSKHEEKIKHLQELEFDRKQNIKQQSMKEIEDLILSRDNFKFCTNANMRREFTNNLFKDKSDFFSSVFMHQYELDRVVDMVWNKNKDNFKKK